ncbi:MAG TPA: hypothetical protein VK021_01455 [Flavobacteriaceae bacterium]|nr:hypothetical protein [Flavobacteriaceae bacterium]
MKIYIKKKWLTFHLIIGLAFIVLGILAVTANESIHWTQYGYLVIGLIYLGMYFYTKNKPYLHFENNVLKVHSNLKTKTINLNEIESARKFGGDYKFRYEGKEIVINTQLLDPLSLDKLDKELEKYDLKWS